MKILTLDFESYFSADYGLKKLSTEEYVRDPRFKAHMVGIKYPGHEPVVYEPRMLRDNPGLRQDIETSAVLCHHAHFDGLILEHHYGLKPALWLDTLSMARLALPRLRSHSLGSLAQFYGLSEKSVPYDLFRGLLELPSDVYYQLAAGCKHDVALTWAIAEKLLPLVPPAELKVIDSTIRMFTQPVLRLDRTRMEAFLKAEKIRKARAMLDAGVVMGMKAPTHGEESIVTRLRTHLAEIETELQSSDKFRIALEALGYPCPMKHSEKQDKLIPALSKTDEGMKGLLEHDDHRIQALASARLGVKSTIDETRAERLLDSDRRGALPVYLSYAAAKTLRFGGGDKTNWQNFRRGGEIRKSILAPEGHKLVIGDLSQIEYRLLLWLTRQLDKLAALAAGQDLYIDFASQFYGEPVVKEDKLRRGVGKQGILMSGYGAGAGTMIATAAGGGYGPPVKLSDAEGQRMVDIYRSTHPMVKAFWKQCDHWLKVLHDGGTNEWVIDGKTILRIAAHKIHLPNGTWLDYTGLRWATNNEVYPDQANDGQGPAWWEPSRKGYTRTWGSHITADIVQALACAVIKDVWVRMLKRHVRPALQVHDELVFVVPTQDAERVAHGLETEMKTPPSWCSDIPLDCEIIVSERYEK